MKPADKAPGGDSGNPRKVAPKCALCGKPQDRAFRPFCSKRCADVDLGRWLRGTYVVPGEPAGAEGDETSS